MQRMDILPAALWFPSLAFYIPFSQASPIPPLPALPALETRAVAGWLGQVAVNSSPFIAYYLWKRVRFIVSPTITRLIWGLFPSPVSIGRAAQRKPVAPQTR